MVYFAGGGWDNSWHHGGYISKFYWHLSCDVSLLSSVNSIHVTHLLFLSPSFVPSGGTFQNLEDICLAIYHWKSLGPFVWYAHNLPFLLLFPSHEERLIYSNRRFSNNGETMEHFFKWSKNIKYMYIGPIYHPFSSCFQPSEIILILISLASFF